MSKISKQQVEGYGIYKDKSTNYTWLLEPRENYCALGVDSSECPFFVKGHLLVCPHRAIPYLMNREAVDEIHVKKFERAIHKFLIFKAIDPFTQGGCYFVKARDPYEYKSFADYLVMTDPTVSTLFSADSIQRDYGLIMRRLCSSNLSKILIYGIETRHYDLVTRLAVDSVRYRGTLILACTEYPAYKLPPTYQVDKEEDLEERAKYLKYFVDKNLVKPVGLDRLHKKLIEGWE